VVSVEGSGRPEAIAQKGRTAGYLLLPYLAPSQNRADKEDPEKWQEKKCRNQRERVCGGHCMAKARDAALGGGRQETLNSAESWQRTGARGEGAEEREVRGKPRD